MSRGSSVTDVFRYVGYDVDAGSNSITCRYEVGGERFTERVTFPAGGDWRAEAVQRAARWVFLLAGVSYYKTVAPPAIDVSGHDVTPDEADFLRMYYVEGLGEFAYKNGLDLGALEVLGASGTPPSPLATARSGRALVPFGGGIDSIVTVELMRSEVEQALFIVDRRGARFEAIETAARATGLPVVRAEREIDAQLLAGRSTWLNGHVPITAIISAIALVAAALEGRDEVVMSNEWSASSATIEVDGRSVNHQFSKSFGFETAFRSQVSTPLGIEWYSRLRPYSELLIARRFATLDRYHRVFRSCNRAFHLDPAQRLDHWCGVCDKCCFIDLILSPFLSRATLDEVFDGLEPLANESLRDRFEALLDLDGERRKPFECVGDVTECRVAVLMTAARADRADQRLVHDLARATRAAGALPSADDLLHPIGPHFIPARYAVDDLVA
jgi:hypothetical protein